MSIFENKKVRITYRIALWVFAVFFIAGVTCDYAVTRAGIDKIFYTEDKLPTNEVGLLLATKTLLSDSTAYSQRVGAAKGLYFAGKIERIVVSGSTEPGDDVVSAMHKDLVAGGVPDSLIRVDGNWQRAYDVVARAKHLFGLGSFTVIAHTPEDELFLFLAKNNGIEAVAYSAGDVNLDFWQVGARLKEYAARTEAAYDVLFGVEPRLSGKSGYNQEMK